MCRRNVPARPRRISYAVELTVPDAHATAYAQLLKKIEAGSDLRAYISRSLEEAAFDDDLFNDWRIQHFHFYERPARSGDVVFAIVQPDDFYIIGAFPHRQWSLREILERVHRNWPEVIVRNRVHNVLGTESGPLSDAEIDARRKAGIVSLLELSDGSVYFPPGGGLTSARTSIETNRAIFSSRLRA